MIINKVTQFKALFILFFVGALFQSCQDENRFKFERGKKMIYQSEYRDSLERLISSEIIEFVGTGEKTHFSDSQEKIFYNFGYSSTDSAEFVNNPRLYTDLNYSLAWQKSPSQGIINDESRLWMHPLRSNQYRFTQDCPFPHVVFPLEKGKKWEGFARTGTGYKVRIFSNYTVEKQAPYSGLFGEINDCWYISSTSDFKGIKNNLNMVFHEKIGFVLLEYLLHNGDRVTIDFMKEGLVDETEYVLFEKRDERNR